MTRQIIELCDVTREFRRGRSTVSALKGVSVSINQGEFVSVMGRSGSGKSTLLHVMSGLLLPTSGRVSLLGRELRDLSDDEATLLRRQRVGFVFQFFNLLPSLTAAENVALPLFLGGVRRGQAIERARAALERFGLADRAEHRPDELSGGQLQRVAIARALVNDPLVIFADEPTGNLDSRAGTEILENLRDLQVRDGRSIVMVTHDAAAAAYGTRLITLSDGLIASDQEVPRGRPAAGPVEADARP